MNQSERSLQDEAPAIHGNGIDAALLEGDGEGLPPADQPETAAQPTGPSDDDRERATKAGWVDKDAWVALGKRASAWVDAGQFLDFHDRVEASRKRENIRLNGENARLQAEMAEIRKELEESKKFRNEFTQARGEVQEASLWNERRQALENGDHALVNELDRKIMDARESRKAPPAAEPAKPNGQQMDPRAKELLDGFANDYPIYRDQNMLKLLVKGMSLTLQADPTLRERDLLEEAHDTAKRIWSDRYQTAAQRPAMAETRGAPSASRAGSKGWSDLKPESRVALDGLIKSSSAFAGMKLPEARALILKNASDSDFVGN